MIQEIPKDPIVGQIEALYDLGEGGQYEIIKRTIAIFEPLLIIGWSSKRLVDRMMDKGVKSLELGISICVAVSRTNPMYLSGLDSSLRSKFLKDNKEMLADWEKCEKQNE